MNTFTVVGDQLIRNSTLCRDWLCAVCFGGLVEREGQVVCGQYPHHQEYIKKTTAAFLCAEADMMTQAPQRGKPVLTPLGSENEDFEGFD